MTAIPKIGLGTVQFGRPYGLTNDTGQVPEDEVRKIIDIARGKGVISLDTAPGYGTAESVLGGVAADWKDAELVTKTPVLRDMAEGRTPGDAIRETFEASLQRLGRGCVHGLMVHLADELLSDAGDAMWSAMTAIRDAGGTVKIGACCYTAEEALTLIARYDIEILQLPMNVFDQRMAQYGVLEKCRARGIEVHARSAFLQGLLLTEPEALKDGFASAAAPLRAFRDAGAGAGVSPLALALAYPLSVDAVDRVIVGVTSASELSEILDATRTPLPDSIDFAALASEQVSLITPSMWPPDNDETYDFRYAEGEEGA